MSELHLDSDVLAALALSADKRDERTDHATKCAICESRLKTARSLDAALAHRDVWDESPTNRLLEPRPEDVIAAGKAAARANPDHVSEARVEEIISRWIKPWRDGDGRRRFETAGVVRLLMIRLREQFHRQPLESLRLADIAIELGEALVPESWPGDLVMQLRGEAWKDRANALRLLGRFPEALVALDRSARAFGETLVDEPYLAMVDYVRATVLREMDDIEAALLALSRASEVFERFGYARRVMHCEMVRAGTLYRVGRIREARDTYLAMIDRAETRENPHDLAMLYNNVASAYMDLGEYTEAADFYRLAIPLSRELGLEGNRLRSLWGLARILLGTGKTEEGLEWLQRTMESFQSLEMDEERALVLLDIADVLLSLGLKRRAVEICREVLPRFETTGSRTGVLRALAYMKDALREGHDFPDVASRLFACVREAEDARLRAGWSRLLLNSIDPDSR